MGSDVKKAYGAAGRDELLWFDPETLVLVEDPSHPLYDERVKMPLDERFVLNVMAKGVLEPIIVRKNGERDGIPVVEVVDGRQRVRGAREANKRLTAEGKAALRVPATRMRGSDGDLLGVMVSTNELRKDDTPLTKAKKCGRYRALGYSIEEAANTFGVTDQTIRAWEALLECSDEVCKAVERGEVASTVALKLSKLPKEEQGAALDKLKEAGLTKGKRGESAAAAAAGATPRARMLTRREVKELKEVLQQTVQQGSKDEVEIPDAVQVLGYVLKGSVPKRWQRKVT